MCESGKHNSKTDKGKSKMCPSPENTDIEDDATDEHSESSDSDFNFVLESSDTGSDADGGYESEELSHFTTPKKKNRKGAAGETHQDDDCVVPKITFYRSNLLACIKGLKALRFKDVHMHELKKTPLWLMFKAIHKASEKDLNKRLCKHQDDIHKIILSFDSLTNEFAVGPSKIALTPRDMQHIFGIGGGKREIPVTIVKSEAPRWIKRCFKQEIALAGGTIVLTTKKIYEKLFKVRSEDGIDSIVDTARLVNLYIIATVLAPNQNTSIPPHLAGYYEKLEETNLYDWCSYFVGMLIKQIKKSKKKKVGDCAMVLPFWLLEHTNLLKPAKEDGFPRFMKWDLNALTKKLMGVTVTSLKPDLVIPTKLRTADAEKEQFAKLLRFWRKEFKGISVQISEGVTTENEVTCTPEDGEHPTCPDVIAKTRSDSGSDEEVCPTIHLGTDNGNSDFSGERGNNHKDASTLTVGSPKEKSGTQLGDIVCTGTSKAVFCSTPLFDLQIPQTPVKLQSLMENGINEAVERCVSYGLSETELSGLKAKVEESRILLVAKDEEISLLKKEMETIECRVRNNFKSEMEELMKCQIEACKKAFEARLISLSQLKDEAIEKISSEKSDLEEQVKMLTTPTFTQICANPQSLAQIDAIEREHIAKMTVKETIVPQEDEVGGPEICKKMEVDVGQHSNKSTKTPQVQRKKRGRKPLPTPTSLAKRVKGRGDRKCVNRTPPPSTPEIIHIHEGSPDPFEAQPVRREGALTLDFSFDAVGKTAPEIRAKLIEEWAIGGDGRVVYLGITPLARATVSDLLVVLYDGRVSGDVIDSWEDILMATYGASKHAATTVFFSSSCWDLIYKKNQLKTLKALVDDRLHDVNGDSVLLFPMNVKEQPGASRGVGDHCTLLVLDLYNCEWIFLNSTKPRKEELQDPHLTGSHTLIDYVEPRLRKIFESKFPYHRLLRGELKRPKSVACLQQKSDSLDCGVVVCLHLESYLNRIPRKTGPFSHNRACEYRSKMVSWFLEPCDVEVASPDMLLIQ